MLKKERQNFIVKQVNVHNKVLSGDLSLQLNVSEDTIRRDLNELANDNKLIKVHGGALSKSYQYSYSKNEIYSFSEKQIIVQKALPLIKEGMYILMTGGTTLRELAQSLPNNLHLTIITVSPSIALQLVEHPNIKVLFVGGQFSKNAQITVGGEVVERLSEIKADIYFTGINGIDVNSGISEMDQEVVYVKKAMMKAAEKTVALCISEKLNTQKRLKVCDVDNIDILITELEPTHSSLHSYSNKKIKLL